MRSKFAIFAISIIAVFSSLLHAEETTDNHDLESILNASVYPFFVALKEGDVSSIKQLIAGEMYESKKVLLEKNEEYPEFLKNYYQGIEFYVENATQSGNYIIVDFLIEFPGGNRNFARLYLEQTTILSESITISPPLLRSTTAKAQLYHLPILSINFNNSLGKHLAINSATCSIVSTSKISIAE